jgi:hypothetical protein
MFVVAMTVLGLSLLTARNITPKSHQERPADGLTASVQKLVFLPEPLLKTRILIALHAEGLIQHGPHRTDIVWDNGKFRYVTPSNDINPSQAPR